MSALAIDGQPPWFAARTRAGLAMGLIFLILGATAVGWTPYPVERLDVGATLQDPSVAHLFGTDQLGRDVFSLVMKSILTSFVIGATASGVAGLGGALLGLGAASWTRSARWLTLPTADYFLLLPALVAAALFAAAGGASAIGVTMAIAVGGLPLFVRVAWAGSLALRDLDYVSISRLAGLSAGDAWRKYVVPHLIRLMVVQMLAWLPTAMLLEAGLSYAGIGVQPPLVSFGLILRDVQAQMPLKPLLVILPGVALLALVLSLTLIAAGLRQSLKPQLRTIGAIDGAD
ncbi:MAG: ABC transporter permease subunit [Devosia sp.]